MVVESKGGEMHKKNYRNTFNRCTFIDSSQNVDFDFIRLAKKQGNLTFNTKYFDPKFTQITHTPFMEIERYDNFLDFTDCSIGTHNENMDYKKYSYILKSIVEEFKNTLRKIDPKEKYFFSCSAGSDSRIITALLSQLRDEEGYDFDNVLFHCWGRPEQDSFLSLMNRFRWKNVSILDDSVADVYDVGTNEISVNGWYPYDSQMKFWGDINTKNYILLSGAEGETLLRPFDIWKNSHGFFSNRGESIHFLANKFKDVFFPYLTKDMLNITMKIPHFYKNIPDNRIGRDKIRSDICELLGVLDIPMPKPVPGSYYNFNFSSDRKKMMIDLWNKSRFKKEFDVEISYEDLFSRHNTYSSKMWGFAVTVYEKVFL